MAKKKIDLGDPIVISDACTLTKSEFQTKYKEEATEGMLALSWHNLRKTHGNKEKPAATDKKQSTTKPVKEEKEKAAKPEKAEKPVKEKKEKAEKAPSLPQAGSETFMKDEKVSKIVNNTEISKSEKMRQLFTLGSVTIDKTVMPLTVGVVAKLTNGHYSFVYGVHDKMVHPEKYPSAKVKDETPAKEKKEKKSKKAADIDPGDKEPNETDDQSDLEEDTEEAPDEVNAGIAERLAGEDTDEEAAEEEIEEEVIEEKPAKKTATKKAVAEKPATEKKTATKKK